MGNSKTSHSPPLVSPPPPFEPSSYTRGCESLPRSASTRRLILCFDGTSNTFGLGGVSSFHVPPQPPCARADSPSPRNRSRTSPSSSPSPRPTPPSSSSTTRSASARASARTSRTLRRADGATASSPSSTRPSPTRSASTSAAGTASSWTCVPLSLSHSLTTSRRFSPSDRADEA